MTLIKAAINGGRSKAEHPAVPVSPAEQAAAVAACLRAGAGAIHLHVRFTADKSIESPKESLNPDDVAQTLTAVRAVAPNASIGVSTGAWIIPDPAERLQTIASWRFQPDFASVNFSEQGAVELAQLFLSRGVGVEAGLIDAASAQALVASGLTASCLRVLLEPQEQEVESALQTVRGIEDVLAAAVKLPPLLLHGTELTTWPMFDAALARGYDARIGLEDTLLTPDGKKARDNLELISLAMIRAAEKP